MLEPIIFPTAISGLKFRWLSILTKSSGAELPIPSKNKEIKKTFVFRSRAKEEQARTSRFPPKNNRAKAEKNCTETKNIGKTSSFKDRAVCRHCVLKKSYIRKLNSFYTKISIIELNLTKNAFFLCFRCFFTLSSNKFSCSLIKNVFKRHFQVIFY